MVWYIQFKEMTEWLQNCRFNQTKSIILLEWSKIKIELKFQIALHITYVQKTYYFEVALSVHTITYKNIDNLFENYKFIFFYDIKPNNMMFKSFFGVLLGVLFIKEVYVSFKNPWYIFL